MVVLLFLGALGCETEADRRKERLEDVAQTVRARLREAELPTVPHGEEWSAFAAADVRVIVGGGVAVDRAARALWLYGADPDAYADSSRPIPEAGSEVLALRRGALPDGVVSPEGTLPALAEALRPPPTAGRMGETPSEGVPPHRGALDLAVGSEIPYRTFAAVLRTVVRARYAPRLVARGPHALVQLPIRTPAVVGGCRSVRCIDALTERRALPEPAGESRSGAPARLDLTIAIGEDGVDVFGSGGALAHGCERVRSPGSEGNTVPRRGGTIDRSALESCLAKVADGFPGEDAVLIQPDPATPFNEVAIVASIAFGDDRFPELLFAEPEND